MSSDGRTTVRIDSLQWPITVLGFGARIGIWFQGCSIGCTGCCARHTWDAEAGKDVSLDDLLDWIRNLPLAEVHGVTITGGEPFEQPEALHRLAVGLRERIEFVGEVDLLCYSGFPWKRLRSQYRHILEHFDVIIAEPYVKRLRPEWLRGSSNQTIHPVSELGRRRYENQPERRNELQIVAGSDGIRMVGIPGRGDLEKMERLLSRQGVTFGARSW